MFPAGVCRCDESCRACTQLYEMVKSTDTANFYIYTQIVIQKSGTKLKCMYKIVIMLRGHLKLPESVVVVVQKLYGVHIYEYTIVTRSPSVYYTEYVPCYWYLVQCTVQPGSTGWCESRVNQGGTVPGSSFIDFEPHSFVLLGSIG